MSSSDLGQRSQQERKSRTPCIVLPIVGVFVLMLCYVVFVVVRNVSPTAIKEAEGRKATATSQTSIEVDAGATIAVELQIEATQTASALPSSAPPEQTTETETPQPTPNAISPVAAPTSTTGASP